MKRILAIIAPVLYIGLVVAVSLSSAHGRSKTPSQSHAGGGYAVFTYSNYWATNNLLYICSNGVTHPVYSNAHTCYISNVCPSGDYPRFMWCSNSAFNPTATFQAFDAYTNPPLAGPLRTWTNKGDGGADLTGAQLTLFWHLNTPYQPTVVMGLSGTWVTDWGWCTGSTNGGGGQQMLQGRFLQPSQVIWVDGVAPDR